jgi:hypothetical protein
MFIVIAAISLTVAIIMSGVVWRMTRAEHRRSEARVATLTSDLAEVELAARDERTGPVTAPTPDADQFRACADQFRTAAPQFRAVEPGHSHFAPVLAVGGFAVATALALIVVTSRDNPTASGLLVAPTVQPANAAPGPRSTADVPPLELVALGHEREGDRLIVRGVVRNPKTGVLRDRVAVVVFLFNRDGGFLASGLAAVEVPALAAGSQSGFIVTVPDANEVGRYRVSFRSDDRMVPHIDRRQHGPIAQLQ